MVNVSQQLIWDDANAVPTQNIGSLLGAKPGNRYFTRRINAAAELYHAGKVKWLLINGDNGRKDYDGASGIQQTLVAKDVPAKVIFCDYAGLLALGSVVRAKKVFSENHITIVSQEFHNQRAIWLAKQYGVDAIGFNAPDPNMKHGFYTQLQEKLTRISAVIDVKILHRQPRCLKSLVMVEPFSGHGCPTRE